jgi:hypothetical protein
MLTNEDLGVVAGAPAHRDVDLALALDLGGVMCPRSSRTGTVSVNGAAALQPPDVGDGGSGARYSAELARCRPRGGRPPHAGRRQPVVGQSIARHDQMSSPGTRKEVCRARSRSASSSNSRVLEEDLAIGPVAHPRAGHAAGRLADNLSSGAVVVRRERCVGVGPFPGRVGEHAGLAPPEAHRIGLAAAVDLDVEAGGLSALTTDAPTPCRPPEAV